MKRADFIQNRLALTSDSMEFHSQELTRSLLAFQSPFISVWARSKMDPLWKCRFLLYSQEQLNCLRPLQKMVSI